MSMPEICEICGGKFKSIQALGAHKHYKHGDSEKDEGSKGSKEGSRERLEVKGSKDRPSGRDKGSSKGSDNDVYKCSECGYKGLVKGQVRCQICGERLDWGAIGE